MMTTHSNGSNGTAPDYYEALRLQPGADAGTVERAYWYLARRYNAALESDPDARDALDSLNEAYRVLSSPVLRREYDFSRNIEPPAGAAPPQALASIMNLTAERARWRQGARPQTPAFTPRQVDLPQIALPEIALPDLKTLPWRKIVGGVIVLVLGAIALFEGAQPGVVVTLVVIGLVFAGLPLGEQQDAPAAAEKPAPAPRQLARPENLGDVLIPRGTSRNARKLVYQIYDQCPHLGPADARAVTRYAMLSQRFMDGERQLHVMEEEGRSEEALQLAGEQRALAAELRLHEAALNITAVAREDQHNAELSQAEAEPAEGVTEEEG